MIRLGEATWPVAYEIYRRHEAFFPLIAAVLGDRQNGAVFADRSDVPRRVYVEHAFGFAQLFGEDNAGFDESLRRYLLLDRAFASAKVRLYTPDEPEFLRGSLFDHERSERRRFVLDANHLGNPGSLPPSAGAGIEIRAARVADVTAIDDGFGVVRRFWRSDADFAASSLAVVAWDGGWPAAICYAAAVADGQAEVDVLTRPEYRGKGLGKSVVLAFTARCRESGLKPVWDCFTNNAGSMALARSCGFVPAGPAYPFYTLGK